MKKIKLNKILFEDLGERQMKEIRGGGNHCQCGCCYTNAGGSSTDDNGLANRDAGGYTSPCNGGGFMYPPDAIVTPSK